MSEFIKSFLFLVLVLTLIRSLSPSKSYDKYIKLFVSILFITSVISPILSFIKGEDYQSVLNENISIVNNKTDSFMSEQIQKEGNNYILEEYKKRLSDDIKEKLKKRFNKDFTIEISINEDNKNEEYANVTGIYISYENSLNTAMKEMIKKYIKKVYSVDEENIYIKAGKN